MATVRVATSQYVVTNDIPGNLQKILDVIDEAANGGAQLVAVPEFANHTCIYDNAQHAWDVAVEDDGDFLQAIRAKAKERGIHVVVNATRRGEEFPRIYDTNFLIGPDGEIIGRNDKSVLIGVEHMYITPAPQEGGVYDTSLGKVGLYSCMDGVLPEVPRLLALQGAQVLVNTLNSMAKDEPGMHIPVRAAENGVWVVAANKVGPIVEEAAMADIVERLQIPAHILQCLGEVQVVAPDGSVVVEADAMEVQVVFADIDPDAANSKAWGDGDLFADRRPDTYHLVTTATYPHWDEPAPPPFRAAVVQVRSDRPLQANLWRALDLARDAAATGSSLVVLPELFPFRLEDIAADPARAAADSLRVLAELRTVAREARCWLATSLVEADGGRYFHTVYLVDREGDVAGTYRQVHLVDSMKAWATAGNQYAVIQTPLGRIGLMAGYDAVFPEVATILARLGAEVIVHPTSWRLPWEVRYGMPERAGENRVSIVSAARWDSPQQRGGLIVPAPESRAILHGDLSPVWPVEAMRDREGYVGQELDPAQSRRKLLGGDDVLAGRRPELYERLVREGERVAVRRQG